MKLWVRAGDADDYHGFAGYQQAAVYLYNLGVRKIDRFGLYGAQAERVGYPEREFFRWRNYISLFWARDKAHPDGDITSDDIDQINVALKREDGHG